MRTHIHRHSPTSASSLPSKPGRTATHQQNMGDWETLNSTYLVCVLALIPIVIKMQTIIFKTGIYFLT